MPDPNTKTVAEIVVDFLIARGVDRVFGLQGGHIQPIWDQLGQRGVRIVDVRDEGAAVHMAQAHAALGGGVGIAMVTAGPGVTNCVTAMANAQLERVPVLLIGGCAPVAQDDLGPLQGIAHVDIMRPVTRQARTLRFADNVLRDLDKAYATAAGDGNPPGPVYVEIPTDVLRTDVPPKLVLPEWLAMKPPRRLPPSRGGRYAGAGRQSRPTLPEGAGIHRDPCWECCGRGGRSTAICGRFRDASSPAAGAARGRRVGRSRCIRRRTCWSGGRAGTGCSAASGRPAATRSAPSAPRRAHRRRRACRPSRSGRRLWGPLRR